MAHGIVNIKMASTNPLPARSDPNSFELDDSPGKLAKKIETILHNTETIVSAENANK